MIGREKERRDKNERRRYGFSMRRRGMDEIRDKGGWRLGIWVRGRDMVDRQGQG
jgi:hypothetical protein